MDLLLRVDRAGVAELARGVLVLLEPPSAAPGAPPLAGADGVGAFEAPPTPAADRAGGAPRVVRAEELAVSRLPALPGGGGWAELDGAGEAAAAAALQALQARPPSPPLPY